MSLTHNFLRKCFAASVKITLAVRIIARQLREKNCLAAVLTRDIKMSRRAPWVHKSLFSELNSYPEKFHFSCLNAISGVDSTPQNDIARLPLWFRASHGRIVVNRFLGKISFRYTKYCFRTYFCSNFWLECKWGLSKTGAWPRWCQSRLVLVISVPGVLLELEIAQAKKRHKSF